MRPGSTPGEGVRGGDAEDRGYGEAPSLLRDAVTSNPGGSGKAGQEPRTESRERSRVVRKGASGNARNVPRRL